MRFPTLVLLAAIAIACAKTRVPAASPAERTEPPQLLTRGNFPELSAMVENRMGGPPPRLRIQVVVDSLGRADVKTLKLTGTGSGPQNRAAIERWLDAVIFRPAMRNGQPTSGVFEGTLAVRLVQSPF